MPAGRPPKFKDKESLQIKIDEYSEECKPTILENSEGIPFKDRNGAPIIQMNPPTITGLALFLGFVSRRSIYDYENNGEFSHTIKKARLKCETFIEQGLYSGNIPPAAGIFALKNYGWSDRQEIDLETNGAMNIKVNISDASDDE